MEGNLAQAINAPEESCPVCGVTQPAIFDYQGYTYCRCGSCGLVSTYPIPEGAVIEAHYAKKFQSGNYKLVQDYSKELSKGVYSGFVNVLEKKLAERGTDFKGKEVLDIGCFTGEFLELLQDRGASVCGIELQSEAVEIAKQRLGGNVFKADVFSNDFPNKKFDIVTMLGVIEHVTMPMKLIARGQELLKPGGILLIQTPDSGSMLAHLMGKYWMPYAPVEHIHLFSRKSLEKALQSLGFVNVSYRPHWKKHQLGYCYNQLQNFGPEFYRLFAPIYKILPQAVRRMGIPFYIGEMLVSAEKKNA